MIKNENQNSLQTNASSSNNPALLRDEIEENGSQTSQSQESTELSLDDLDMVAGGEHGNITDLINSIADGKFPYLP